MQGRLARYVAKFNFRYSNRVKLGVDDAARTVAALRGIVGKRLTYRKGVAWQPLRILLHTFHKRIFTFELVCLTMVGAAYRTRLWWQKP